MDTLRQDLLYACRRLAMAPGFTFVAMATLALGIGANSAIFSLVHAVLLKPLPYPEPDRLVQLYQTHSGRNVPFFSPQNFLDTKEAARSFDSMAAVDGGSVTLTNHGEPAVLTGAEVSAAFFQVFRVTPTLGRVITAEENQPEQSGVVVLAHSLWTERFGADPKILGATITLDSRKFTVVGIAPPGFAFPEGVELWTPLSYDQRFRSQSRGAWYLRVFARLNPGVSEDAAQQEVRTIASRLSRSYPDANDGLGGALRPLREALVGDSRQALYLLLGAVGLVLLIACVNVANLLLARAAARESEFAVRQALGAGRGRLFRQLMTESLLLAVLGGVGGLLAASVSLDALIALQPSGVRRLGEARIDPTVMIFGAALSLLTGLLCGVLPGLSSRSTPAQALREGGRGLLAGRTGRIRGGLVVGQMALAMMLLAGAGLLIRSFAHLQQVETGFDVTDALTFRLSLPEASYKDDVARASFFDRLLPRLAALPGVRSSAATAGLPLNDLRLNISFTVKNRPPLPPAQQASLEMRTVTPDYFRAMGIPVIRGRGIDARDTAEARQVVVLSEAAVRRYFKGENPLGQWITLGWGRSASKPPAGGEIVGIVRDVKNYGLARESAPEIYLPYAQLPLGSMDVLVRTTVPPLGLGPSIEKVVHELDRDIPVARVRTLEDVVARCISQPRFYMLLLAVFAGMAVFLAALGIFGVMSYGVAQRKREIGIRLALGARPGAVLRLIMGNALALSLAGVALGLVGALALSRYLASLLFNLSPTDPLTLGAVALALLIVALLASYLPALQATRIDPQLTLRSE